MRLTGIAVAAIAAAAVTVQAAGAATEADVARLKEYFLGLGDIHYELYAPLSSPDQPVGGAVISNGESGTLHVARVEGGRVGELLSVSLPELNRKPPFTFLLTGMHLMVYPTREWADADGRTHRRGDLQIYDLVSAETPQQVFELKDVCDLNFQAGGALSTENLLAQPSRHFLNRLGMLPVKHEYCWLRLDLEQNNYELFQHLTALPNAATVDAANLNNRGILRYYEGRLMEASQLLAQADSVASADQSIIARNQNLVNSEMDDLGVQSDKFPEQRSDEALEYYWQGNYLGVLRVMDTRGQYGYADYEAAIFGLALAHENRWRDADRFTAELERQQAPFLADYLWELAKIAYGQSRPGGGDTHSEIGNARLLKLEVLDRQHPGYVVGLSRLLRQSGDLAQAEQVLEDYLANPANASRDLTEPRMELYELYNQRGYFTGCERLTEEALRGPLLDLAGYVKLKDYVDFSTALIDIPLDSSGRIKAPEKPLEVFEVN